MRLNMRRSLAVQCKAIKTEPDSPAVAYPTKVKSSHYPLLCRLALAAAMVTAAILALHKTPAAAGALEHKSRNGATAPWEKTGGPPGLTVNVIYKSNNIVYASTVTQGIYKSTDDGLNWVTANNGIDRSFVHDIIA